MHENEGLLILILFVIGVVLMAFDLARTPQAGTPKSKDSLVTKSEIPEVDINYFSRFAEIYRTNTSVEQKRADQLRTAQALYFIVALAVRGLPINRQSLIASTQQRITQSMFGYAEHVQSKQCAQSFFSALNGTGNLERQANEAADFLMRMEVAGICNLGIIATHIAVVIGVAAGKGDLPDAQIQPALERVVVIALRLNCKLNLILDSLRQAADFAGRTFDLAAIRERQIEQAYTNLGIDRNITEQEFRRVKRRKLAEFHPDKAPQGKEQEYTIKFQQINAWCELIESQWK